jgi:magnesium transporter
MLKFYNTAPGENKPTQIKEIQPDCWIDLSNPSQNEIETVVEKTKIDRDLVMKMLDDDELPRTESSNGTTLVVIDVPVRISHNKKHTTYPLGIVIAKNRYIVTISTKASNILDDFKKGLVKDFHTGKKTRFLIQIITLVSARYLGALKEIHSEISQKEEILKKSTQNEDLIDLLATEKTLVYFMTSLKENDIVFQRLSKGLVVPLYESDLDLLEDAMIENNQAVEMATIYRDVLSSITETYGTIISNNLNNVMKFLAGATIVLSIPTIISSFLGMNVPFGEIGISPWSAITILLFSVFASLLIAFWLKKKGML